jgi:NitT/TauT family transport system ATP-binding protein
MVFQDYTSFDNRTVLDNVVFGLECRGVPRREREAEGHEWIARVGLDPRRDAGKYPHELSGGMRQRVAIARTLILRPRVILMDEPFGALDPATRLDMQDLLVKLWREVQATVLFVTHSVEEAVYLGDRVFVMATTPGRIVDEIRMPAAAAPARETQSAAWFHEQVNALHARIEQVEAAARRPDGAGH